MTCNDDDGDDDSRDSQELMADTQVEFTEYDNDAAPDKTHQEGGRN